MYYYIGYQRKSDIVVRYDVFPAPAGKTRRRAGLNKTTNKNVSNNKEIL